jgi:glycosyltransferase involved in cell wall biosynthesis
VRKEQPAGPDIAILLGRFGSGGVERVACLLANGFAGRRWSTEIWTASREGPARSSLARGLRIASLLPGRSGGRKLRLLLSILPLAWRIRRTRPAIFLSPGNHTHLAAGLAYALAGRADVRLVVKITNPLFKDWHRGLRQTLKYRYYRWLYRKADEVIVLSPAGADEVRAVAGDPTIRVRFVHNPYIRACTTPPAPDCAAGTPMVLAVGRLSEQKNFALLLDAMALITDRNWQLVLLGEGPQATMLKARANALGLADRVVFPGYVSDPGPYYDRARCLALSSLWEELPAVALEAMGRGCPVVTTDSSRALRNLVSETGFGSVVPIDAAALAQAIAAYLDTPANHAVPAAVAAYSVENGVREHADALAPFLGGQR